MGHRLQLAGLVLGVVVVWLGGCKAITRGSGGKREAVCYTGLILWCAFILVSRLFNWVLPTTATFMETVFYPAGYWLKRAILGNDM